MFRFFPQIVIDFIPHVRAHFETCYHERKQLILLAQNGPKTHETSPGGSQTSASETKQMEALQRQFDQVIFIYLKNLILWIVLLNVPCLDPSVVLFKAFFNIRHIVYRIKVLVDIFGAKNMLFFLHFEIRTPVLHFPHFGFFHLFNFTCLCPYNLFLIVGPRHFA